MGVLVCTSMVGQGWQTWHELWCPRLKVALSIFWGYAMLIWSMLPLVNVAFAHIWPT